MHTKIYSHLQAFWSYLWEFNTRTKQVLKLHPNALIDLSSSANTEEQERAAQLMSDGGQVPVDSSGGTGDGDDDPSAHDAGGEYTPRQKVGLPLGPLLFAILMLVPLQGLSPAGQVVAATTVWVATWWVSESIPIPATSLLPLLLFPSFGALSPENAAAPYADPLVFLFLGGFFIAVTMQRWGLHRRIALRIISAIGTSPTRIILGFMIATGFLSMWISNTASTMMMVPIGLAVVSQISDMIQQNGIDIPVKQGKFRFGTALMLCIAYAATLGGIGTPIGTPPNIIVLGVINETFGREISFLQWMKYGVPIAAIGIAITWVYVTKFIIPPRIDTIPGSMNVIEDELEALGSMSREEKLVLVVFTAVAIAWISRTFVINRFFPQVGDSTIAIFGALALFLIPARDDDGSFTFLLNWTTGLNVPWGVILLFGGGLSLANGFTNTDLAQWIGGLLSGFGGMPTFIIIMVLVTVTIFLTELTSNTAVAALLMPIMASLAIAFSIHPYGLMITTVTAANFAFMFPVATAPNAVVFGSGYITMPQMVRTGFGLDIMGVVLIIILAVTWLPFIWGFTMGHLPAWALNSGATASLNYIAPLL